MLFCPLLFAQFLLYSNTFYPTLDAQYNVDCYLSTTFLVIDQSGNSSGATEKVLVLFRLTQPCLPRISCQFEEAYTILLIQCLQRRDYRTCFSDSLGRNLQYFAIIGRSLNTTQTFLWIYLDTPFPLGSNGPCRVFSITSHFPVITQTHTHLLVLLKSNLAVVEEELTSYNIMNNNKIKSNNSYISKASAMCHSIGDFLYIVSLYHHIIRQVFSTFYI